MYSYIKTYMGHQFILHILLSLVIFETESYLKMHITLCDDLRYAKLIGKDDDGESLKHYSRYSLWRFIEESQISSEK